MNRNDPSLIDNPYPLYRQWRDEQPIWWSDGEMRGWIISRYSDVRRVLKDSQTFSSQIMGEAEARLPLLSDDPPRHTQLRAIVNKAFTSRTLKLLESGLDTLASELLEMLPHNGSVDISGQFTSPLPVTVIAQMMAIPPSRNEDFKRWSDALTGTSEASNMTERMPDILEMSAYFQSLIPERRQNPGEDLISKVVHAEVDGEMLRRRRYCRLLHAIAHCRQRDHDQPIVKSAELFRQRSRACGRGYANNQTKSTTLLRKFSDLMARCTGSIAWPHRVLRWLARQSKRVRPYMPSWAQPTATPDITTTPMNFVLTVDAQTTRRSATAFTSVSEHHLQGWRRVVPCTAYCSDIAQSVTPPTLITSAHTPPCCVAFIACGWTWSPPNLEHRRDHTEYITLLESIVRVLPTSATLLVALMNPNEAQRIPQK
jgi:hypothetical protein